MKQHSPFTKAQTSFIKAQAENLFGREPSEAELSFILIFCVFSPGIGNAFFGLEDPTSDNPFVKPSE